MKEDEDFLYFSSKKTTQSKKQVTFDLNAEEAEEQEQSLGQQKY
jgi:hypothetical protein